MKYRLPVHNGPWESVKYCPAKLLPQDRPEDCGKQLEEGGMLCEFCEEYLKEDKIKFRGFKYARRSVGTNKPEVDPHDDKLDKRHKKQRRTKTCE